MTSADTTILLGKSVQHSDDTMAEDAEPVSPTMWSARRRTDGSVSTPGMLSPSRKTMTSVSRMTIPAGYFDKKSWRVSRRSLFQDKESMKAMVRLALLKPVYRVEDYYHETGLWQHIARNVYFEHFTLLVIVFNAIWLAVDNDNNNAVLPFTDDPIFQIMNNLFCCFYLFEWVVRLGSFKRKISGFKDLWFCLDTVLVMITVLDAWIMPVVLYICANGLQINASPLNLMRLLRLVRIARVARVFHVMPELMILLKGMIAAIRSVTFTFALLLMVLYIFAIAFCQLTASTDMGNLYFNTVPRSMYHLLTYGVFLDSIGSFMDDISTLGFHITLLFLVFVFLAAFTLMNMLIGVLCEVVTSVAECEKEDMAVSYVKGKLHCIVDGIAKENDMISKEGFNQLMRSEEALRALSEVDVDPENLVDLAEFIFEGQDAVGNSIDKDLSFPEFMEAILELRGTNSATVKDLIKLQKALRKHFDDGFHKLEECLDRILGNLQHSDHGLRPRHGAQASYHIVPLSPAGGNDTPSTIGKGRGRGISSAGSSHPVLASEDSSQLERSSKWVSSSPTGTPGDFRSPLVFYPSLHSRDDILPVRYQSSIQRHSVGVQETWASLSAAMINLEQKCVFSTSDALQASFQELRRIVYETLGGENNGLVAVAAGGEPTQALDSQQRAEDKISPALAVRASDPGMETFPSTRTDDAGLNSCGVDFQS